MTDGMYLQVKPFHVWEVLGFHLKQAVNRHVICDLHLRLDVENGEKDRDSIQEKEEITVSLADGRVIFQGILMSAQFTQDMDGITVQLTAASRTCLMDEKRKSRSFQDTALSIQDLASLVKADYDGADMNYSADQNPAVGQFLMQYQETDWQFLQRIASHLNTWLAAEPVSDKIRFFFGCPKRDTQEVEEEELRRYYSFVRSPGISDVWTENDGEHGPEQAIPEYHFMVSGNRGYSIGDKFSFGEKEMVVKEVDSFLKDYVLTHQLVCLEKEMFYCPKRYNPLLAGWNVRARVGKAVEDKVEVHFYEIDEKEPSNYYQFTYMTMYAAEGSGGWYFMPEDGDTVFIKFLTMDEKDAVADGSIRIGEEREDEVLDPTIKRIRTKDGKEIRLTEDEIRISTREDGLFVCISEKDGIQISSHKDIKITSEKEIFLSAKSKIDICGEQELKLSSKSAEITMGATMDIKGNMKVN